MALFWLSDEAWAAIEPHLPRNQPGGAPGGRSAGDLGHPARVEGGPSLVRPPHILRDFNDGVQPV